MERPNGIPNGDAANHGLQIVRYSPYQASIMSLLPWFDLRVFYVRISNFRVNDSTPELLTVNHIPLSPDTVLEVNGVRSGIYTDGAISVLRRDRVDKKSEEATFVSTDSIRLTGSVKFEVLHKEDLILSGILEMSNSNGFTGESKSNSKRWSINCESEITPGSSFLKGDHSVGPELPAPIIEVYVAGSFSGTPTILTKTLKISSRKKQNRKGMLDAIPENETTEFQQDEPPENDLQVADYRHYKTEDDEDYGNLYWRSEYMDSEDGELSWFNAGVRVGVGIGLGICVGLGIGVGLLVRTYQTTTRNFRRRLI